jgi:hypothetical protein
VWHVRCPVATALLYESLVFLINMQRSMHSVGSAKPMTCQDSNLSVFGSHSTATLHYRATSSQQQVPRRFQAIHNLHRCMILQQVRRFKVYLLNSASTDLGKASHRQCQLLQPACYRLTPHLTLRTVSEVLQS